MLSWRAISGTHCGCRTKLGRSGSICTADWRGDGSDMLEGRDLEIHASVADLGCYLARCLALLGRSVGLYTLVTFAVTTPNWRTILGRHHFLLLRLACAIGQLSTEVAISSRHNDLRGLRSRIVSSPISCTACKNSVKAVAGNFHARSLSTVSRRNCSERAR